MQRIPLKYADAGMILGKAVARPDGMVLAGEGTVLTDNIIDRLKNAGLPSIVVKGRPVPALASGLDLKKSKNRLSHLFRRHKENPLMWTLRNMIDQYFDVCIAQEDEARRKEMEANLAPESPPDAK